MYLIKTKNAIKKYFAVGAVTTLLPCYSTIITVTQLKTIYKYK